MNYFLEPFEPDGGPLHVAVHAPLARFNAAALGPFEFKPLGVLLRGEDKTLRGGAWGNAALGWLQVDGLVVDQALRRHGYGAQLIGALEREAVARGCHSAWVDTFEFQARGFYEKMGYTCFGVLKDFPVGVERYFLRKQLAEPVRAAVAA